MATGPGRLNNQPTRLTPDEDLLVQVQEANATVRSLIKAVQTQNRLRTRIVQLLLADIILTLASLVIILVRR